MNERMFHPRAAALARTLTTSSQYDELYLSSVTDPDAFWREQARRFEWIKPFSKVQNSSFNAPDVSIKWFEDGELNACVNCVDRHLASRFDQPAIIWEPDDPRDQAEVISYQELHREVCRFANVLKALGVEKGDRVTIYLPNIPEAAYAMLACARIGAVHTVVFGGFSADSLADRINDSGSSIVVTAAAGRRGGRSVPLKQNVDAALVRCPGVQQVVVVRRGSADVDMMEGRDIWLDLAALGVSHDCAPERMNAEDPLFILYTFGSTGKPKGWCTPLAGTWCGPP